MEHRLLQNLQTLIPSLSDPTSPSRLKFLTLARSLLTNPNSSPQTLDSVVDSLLQTLLLHRNDPYLVRHVIKLLGHDASLNPKSIPAVRSALDGADPCTSAAALAVIDGTALDEETIVSLVSSPYASVRTRAVDFVVKCDSMSSETVVGVLVGLTEDIYPTVRRAAAEGMVRLLKKDGFLGGELMVKCCYDSGIKLTRDEDEHVRVAAVRLISQCEHLFAAVEANTDSKELMDTAFTQLCAVVRDMSLKVKIEAFIALGRVQVVSESVLMQSLSKKILGNSKGKDMLDQLPVNESRFSLARAAGAFVHGIEDEFYEVRAAACKSMGMLATYSNQFAGGALNLLMDMSNDDSEPVRLQTLQALFHMAICDRLVVLQEHMHMFLGLLADNSPLIRRATREVLRLMQLPKLEIFKSAVDGLTSNLVTYPEEEEDIFGVLFFIGKNHGKFSAKRVKAFKLEIAPGSEGDLKLDSPQVAVLLVLSISSSFSDEHRMKDVPAAIFARSVPFFGKISRSLGGIMDCDLLLTYLFHRSEMIPPANTVKCKEVELLQHLVVEVMSNYRDRTDLVCRSSWPVCSKISETSIIENLMPLQHSKEKTECLTEAIQSATQILKLVKGIWPLKQSHCPHEVQRTLRACKEELQMIACSADGHLTAILAFASIYVEATQLYAEIWEQLNVRKLHVLGLIPVDHRLEKLEILLKRMKYCFPGVCVEEERNILELNLFSYVLRMYRDSVCSDLILQKILALVSKLELLYEDMSSELSTFTKELKEACIRRKMAEPSNLFHVDKLIQLFCLEDVPLRGLNYIYAELCSVGHNSENLLPFVPGLPIGITFHITLYNVLNEHMFWLRMTVGQHIQYAFLDLCLFEGSSEVRKCKVNVPFYATPKSASFQLKASVCMECSLEPFMLRRRVQRGPSNDILQLCEEYDIYMYQWSN